jgi:hypothetical protein
MNSDRLKRAMRAAFGSAVGTVRGNGKGLVLGRGRTARAECRDGLADCANPTLHREATSHRKCSASIQELLVRLPLDKATLVDTL